MSIEQQPPKSNKIEVSDMPSLDRTVIPPKEHRDDKDERKLGWKKPAAAVALLGAVAAGAFGGVKALGGERDASDTPRTEPTVSAPATPGEEETAPSNQETEVGPTELSVDRYSDGETLTRAWVAEFNEWMMTGATPEIVENEDFSMTREEYIQSVVAPLDEAYVNALFVNDWQERPQLQTWVEDYETLHGSNIEAYMATSDSDDPRDIEPYKQGQDITSVSVLSSSPDQMVVSYEYERWDNSDKNRANDFFTEPVDGRTGDASVTWVNEAGVWKIADISS